MIVSRETFTKEWILLCVGDVCLIKRTLRVLVFLFCWLFVSIVMAHLWVANVGLFPTIPRAIWEWADSFYQSSNGEELASLEFLGVSVVSSLFVALIGLLAYFLFRKKRLPG